MKLSASPRQACCRSSRARSAAIASCRRVGGRFPHHAALEEDAGALQMLQRVGRARQHQLGGQVHLADDRFRRDAQHAGAFPLRNLHQALAGQRLHGLADRGAADAVARHQLALGGHLVAGLQLAGDDHMLEARKDFVRQLLPDDRFDGENHATPHAFRRARRKRRATAEAACRTGMMMIIPAHRGRQARAAGA